MNSEEILSVLKETNAFLHGHFELSSGLHSDEYVQCALVLQYPDIAQKLAQQLALFLNASKITCVVGPALGGVTFAYEVARSLNVRGIFAERKNGIMQLRRGFHVSDDDRILVVEDVVTTGKSVKEVIALLEENHKKIIGVASIVDRSKDTVDFGYPFHSLIRLPLRSFYPSNCPLCKEGKPVMKPGSRASTS
ncbi:MAG: orotate phosphoribosyltransferase [Candidatus Omnitrophica bacterium]|nr:orotate phosphoribosyltransferase [Candidatus Omnitrophota bacterium]